MLKGFGETIFTPLQLRKSDFAFDVGLGVGVARRNRDVRSEQHPECMRHATKGHPLVIEDAGVLLLPQHRARICLFGNTLPLLGGALLLFSKLLCIHDLQIAVNFCVDQVASISVRDRQSALCSVVCYLDLIFQVLELGGEVVAHVDEPDLLAFERLSQLNKLRLHLFAEYSTTKLITQLFDGANVPVERLSRVNKL